ncbi:MAG: undecaprenyl-phosphate galactose phosphotransferase WbaP [Candidatus Kapaibacterium sp.]
MSIKQANTLNLKDITALVKDTTPTSHSKSKIILRKVAASLLFGLSDVTVLFCSIVAAIGFLQYIGDPSATLSFSRYFSILPFALTLFPFAYLLRGLYPGFGVGVVEELRSLTYCTSIVFLLLAAATLLVNEPILYDQPLFITSWLVALPAVPLGRAFVRKLCGDKQWWGIPVMIIGAGKAGEEIINALQKHIQIGLRPILALDDDPNRWGYIHSIPVVGGLELAPVLGDKLQIDHAIIAMPSVKRERIHQIIQNSAQHFTHLTVIPDLFGLSSLWVSTRDLGGILGLEVQQRLLRKSSYITKRILDITLTVILGLAALPLILVIASLIALESHGSVFFRQERMGRGDKRFKVLKFRTMHNDAEQRLEYLLQQDEELRAEYEFYHKLRNDPRVTRIGRFLRKFSLDELPQFWNVLKGDMSLIGPRAYMPREKYKMSGLDDMILKIHPGISGLWQVTDRNESSFEERVHTDIYYIRNWSMFLDIYILARTIGVVLFGKGGY